MTKTVFTRDDENATLTIERTFSAASDRVWHALTDPGMLDRWWAPAPWKTETLSMDFRVGGFWHYSMTGPEGERHFGRMDYVEIEPGLRYRAKDVFADENGNAVESLPAQTFDTRLVAEADRTRVVTIVSYASLEDLEKIIEMGMQEGLSMAHDQLEALLSEN